MIEESGVVVGLKGEWAIVKPITSGGCSSCSANQGWNRVVGAFFWSTTTAALRT
jgi:positive regulator of sigma E activity